jgi:hypothetical protein
MKRRTFVSSSISLTAGIGTAIQLPGCGNSHIETSGIQYAADQPVELLLSLENQYLKVKIFNNASTEIHDKRSGEHWESWPVALQDKGIVEEGHVWLNTTRSLVQQYPGRFIGKKINDDKLKFTLLGRQNAIVGQFVCQTKLEKDWLVYQITDIDDSIPSLVFPTPLKSDAIIVPKGVGEIIRETASSSIYPRHIYPFFTRLNMRWMGGTKNNAAWIGVFDDGFEDAFGFVANRTATPLWARSLDKWSHPFTYRMKFIKGNYVDIAKTYREWFKKKGTFVSLQDKMDKDPRLDSFLGGRAFWISLAFPKVRDKTADDLLMTAQQKLRRGPDEVNVLFTYKELSGVIDRLKRLGLKKGFIKIAGWINGGYDNSHQDIWPPEPALGEVSELAELLAMEGPLISGLHDNNQDIYAHTPSFPKGVNHNADGTLLTGGAWAGGQAYILNSEASLEYAKRNWKQINTMSPKAMFVDIITAMQLYQSFEKDNQKSKGDDLKAKIELMKFYKDQGILFGSEEVADFGIPYVDWYENRHRRTQDLSIPIWPLVFHDAAFCTRYGGVSRNEGYPGWLEDMLYGYLPHFSIRPDWDQEELFKSLDQVDNWHERIGMAEMTNHTFLSEDNTVEQTEFSTGDAIVCNFSQKQFAVGGKTINPGSYQIIS